MASSPSGAVLNWVIRLRTADELFTTAITVAEIRIFRGTLVNGRVVDSRTGQPVQPGPQSDIGFYGPRFPRSGAAMQSASVMARRGARATRIAALRAVPG